MNYQFKEKTMSKTLFSKGRSQLFLLTTLWSVLILSAAATAQSHSSSDTVEREIRRLEAEQVDNLMNGKTAEMKKNWYSNFTVNNPFNVVQDAATEPVQTGMLTYAKFERNIEKVLLHDSVVVEMGNELIASKTAPKGSSHDTNQPIKRRFTNVWMRKNGRWLMIARHANNGSH
jgi:hypothetical protein